MRLVACALLAAGLAAGQEQESSTSWWQGKHGTGTWSGLRTLIEDAGFTPTVDYTGDYWRNLAGGLEVGDAYMHLFRFGLDWEPAPLIPGWGGALVRVSGIQAHQTRSLTGELVGDLNGVSNLEAPNGFRLYEAWLQQSFAGQRFTLQAGNLLVDENFAATDQGALFLNSGFGWSQFLAANTRGLVPAYPFPAPGVRLQWRTSAASYLQLGAYDGDALDHAAGDLSGNPDGTRFQLGDDQGVFAIAEFGYQLNQADRDDGLPGTWRVGAAFQSGEFEDLYRDEVGGSAVASGLAPHTHEGNAIGYVAIDQMLWRETPESGDTQGLGAFFRLGAGPADRNPFNLVIDGGLHYQGPFPGRNDDAIGLGCVFVGASEDLRRRERDDRDIRGVPVDTFSDYELVLELTYTAWLTPWWTLQPDVQWVLHPGGSAAIEDAWIIGLRTGLTF